MVDKAVAMTRNVVLFLLIVSTTLQIQAQDCKLITSALERFGSSPYYLVSAKFDRYYFEFDSLLLGEMIDTLHKYTNLEKDQIDSIFRRSIGKKQIDFRCKTSNLKVLKKAEVENLLSKNAGCRAEALLKKPSHTYNLYQVTVPVILENFALVQIIQTVKPLRTHARGFLFKKVNGKWNFIKQIYSIAS